MADEQDRARNSGTLLPVIFAAWLIPALLSGLNTYMQSRLEGRPAEWRWVVFNSVDWLLYAVLTPFVFRASRKFPIGRPGLVRKITWHMLGALGMCIIWAALGTLLRLAIFPIPPQHQAWLEFLSWIFTTLPFGVGVYFALVGIERSLFFFARARDRESHAAVLAAQLSEARLSALRMQFNPHFLFNSLNAITVLVRDKDHEGASRMLELLSDVLRQVLSTDATHETTVSSEMEFLKRYLTIEQTRFADRLRPVVGAHPATSSAAVPTFLLQPLVENSLRHGIARRAEAGLLLVTARRDGSQLVLCVGDDGPGLPTVIEPGVGLTITRARLAALYGDAATLELANQEGGGAIATIRLPYHLLSGHE